MQKKRLVILFAMGIFPFMVNGYINSIIFDNPYAYWGFELFSWIVVPVMVFTIAFRYAGLRAADIGLHSRVFGFESIPLLAVTCALFSPVCLWVYRESHAVFSTMFSGEPFFEYDAVMPEEGLLKTLIAIYFSLSAGIVEELYFRGMFYKVAHFFNRPIFLYVVASSLAFSLIHWEGGLSNLCATFVFGLFAAGAYLLIRNLWPLIIGHIYTDYVWFG